MVHYILFKFREGTLTDEVINVFADKYEQLEKRYEGFVNPQIYRNIVMRDNNLDLMVTIEMANREVLQSYLDSEEHLELQERFGQLVEMQFSFDHA